MKKILIFTFLIIGISVFSTGCEKTDYQNPFHRAAHSK